MNRFMRAAGVPLTATLPRFALLLTLSSLAASCTTEGVPQFSPTDPEESFIGAYHRVDGLVDDGTPHRRNPAGPRVTCRFDRDMDGYRRAVDCDDRDASVHPDATEVCGDAVDQDCDGADEACPDTGADDTASDDTASDDTGTDTGCATGTPSATGPNLLTAASFAVLGGSTVTNTGATLLTGDLGVSPGTAITGFPPGIVVGTTHTADATATQAQADLVAAYNDAATRSGATALPADISGMTLVPGVYSASTSLQIVSADLTLDGGGDPNATWIFQVGTTLTTSSGADVLLTGAGCGQAANVYWAVGTSATIGTGTDFIGTVMADQSITAVTTATVSGRLLARAAAVTLDTNIVTVP